MNDLVIHKTPMPFTARHKSAIAPFTDDAGVVTIADVHAGTELIPPSDCAEIVKELTGALVPCNPKDALVLANMLIGCYRVKDVVDAAIYTRTVAEMFADFPPDIGERVRKEIVGKVKWVPTPAEVKESGDRMVRERSAALIAAKKHVSEHYRREAIKKKAAEKETHKGEYEANLKKMYAEVDLEWPGIEKASIMDAVMAGAKVAT